MLTKHNKWKAENKNFLPVYKALIRSKIDCSSIIYGRIKNTTLEKLENVQNANLRLITRASKINPN